MVLEDMIALMVVYMDPLGCVYGTIYTCTVALNPKPWTPLECSGFYTMVTGFSRALI